MDRKLVLMRFLILIAASFLFLACENNQSPWRLITIKEGAHKAKPYNVRISDGNEDETWRFYKSAKYNLGDSDQCDWNKLFLLSYNLISNRKNSLIVSWRWDVDGYWWVAPYKHRNDSTFWAIAPCSSYVSSASPDYSLKPIKVYPVGEFSQAFRTQFVDSAGITILYIENLATAEVSRTVYDYPDNLSPIRTAGTWFGGNRKAPHDVHLFQLNQCD